MNRRLAAACADTFCIHGIGHFRFIDPVRIQILSMNRSFFCIKNSPHGEIAFRHIHHLHPIRRARPGGANAEVAVAVIAIVGVRLGSEVGVNVGVVVGSRVAVSVGVEVGALRAASAGSPQPASAISAARPARPISNAGEILKLRRAGMAFGASGPTGCAGCSSGAAWIEATSTAGLTSFFLISSGLTPWPSG